jgi:invasion protein IalB
MRIVTAGYHYVDLPGPNRPRVWVASERKKRESLEDISTDVGTEVLSVNTENSMRVERTAARCIAVVCLVTIAGGAPAQQQRPLAPRPAPSQQPVPPPQPSPPIAQNENPQRTTATYEDWVVECQTQTGSPPKKVCEMAQVTQVQGRNIPFSRIAIAHPVKAQPVKLLVQVPVNASFQTNVRIQAGDSDPGVAAPFARCVPAGCFADFDIKDETVKRLRAASGGGKLSFVDAGGQNIVIPLSFKGFGAALDALVKE